ncbi:hypothetical protein Ahy_B09g096092 isoform C [Arachis hypogaea]|uniref:PPM-type phosphatase domain-containing protein n=1 Tax=Arachis hypogaea TaxID=3818 RepID=A0A444XIH3_ARAHY|nr:hypothetical protein Ahy_B09g096092 isoform C [Arachis hypogaea]
MSFDIVILIFCDLIVVQEAGPTERISDAALENAVLQFVPCIRSGSFADIGPRRYMEDEHIRIDDLSSHLGSLHTFPKPSAFYGRRRVEELGGYIEDGYLNGVLSVTRALGDWDMKLPKGSSSPLIAEPEFRQMVLTEDDEFLIIGCDGIWDVMSSQHAVSLVRKGLRRHDDPDKCARDLVMEALRLNTFDNLTVIIVCFSSLDNNESSTPPSPPCQRKIRCCSLSAEALCSLRSLLEGSASN